MGSFKKFPLAFLAALLLTGSIVTWRSKGATLPPQSGYPAWEALGNALQSNPVQNNPLPLTEGETNLRTKKININFIHYQWWLINWQTNKVRCEIVTEHEGVPIQEEVLYHCGQEIYNTWITTKSCSASEKAQNHNKCQGLYLYLAGKSPDSKEVEVDLPPANAWISMDGCNPVPPQNTCDQLPALILAGEEPLPNETIVNLQGTINGVPFECPGSMCAIPLPPTGSQGQVMEFWANSSYGDSSQRYTAMLRAMPWGDFMAPEGQSDAQKLWYVDVISSQWKGQRAASCADTWQVFPDIGGPPPWLTTPSDAQGLESSLSLYYLAAMLIHNGVVDSRSCTDGGLESDTAASPCGLEAAMPAVTEWQNRFNNEIYQVSGETGVPGQLLKNVFSRESQFWPGIYRDNLEAGLGQMTENGADTLLLWNSEFFNQFCPLVLSNDNCTLGFSNLDEEKQNILRGALVRQVNATCIDCPVGINLTDANYSVRVFAESLLGNCEQTGRIITNLTSKSPGQVASYEDLWRFTLVNYNAGPGCLASAIQRVAALGQPLTWANLKPVLDPACKTAEGYVEDISLAPFATATPTAWLYPPTATSTPGDGTPSAVTATPGAPLFTPPAGPTPLPTITLTPTAGPTPIPTDVILILPTATPTETPVP